MEEGMRRSLHSLPAHLRYYSQVLPSQSMSVNHSEPQCTRHIKSGCQGVTKPVQLALDAAVTDIMGTLRGLGRSSWILILMLSI